ncbi:PREDICTED: hydroxyproline O-galactosyltransferase HPGT1 isoform X2 [Tarenaya hassleriana]|uniref:hydroxyproline O-galactosyltransferase HPGT1 isoform X2 n=1 Tax=Tarenaya hassleriana TaxID=28532 RepID=UPI00053C6085|nr:PREDICTED: hydroxyproline O-galactosyltransferase HPGT1 isoform X2 [Tarenaya hassleriana]
MQRKGSSNRLSSSRISSLFLSMFATFASFYVAGRLWQESQTRVHLIKELDRITGQGKSVISVDDTLKIIACREQQKKLAALEMELSSARQEGFVSKRFADTDGAQTKRKPLVVIGIMTNFANRKKRDAVRQAWMGTGASQKKLENEKGVIARFVIGRSPNQGDSLDRNIDNENSQTNDFVILENLVEAPEEATKKAKLFFAYAADRWDAQFYAKANDNIYVNIDALGSALATHSVNPRAYIGCMKSGEVFSEPLAVGRNHKWYEPEWWKFGDKKSYFRHASGEMYVITNALARFISINRDILHAYAHDDVSAGSWFIGLDVKHIDEGKFCCSPWSSEAICSGV